MRKSSLAAVTLVLSLTLSLSVSAAESIDLVFPQDPSATEFTDSWGAARSGHSHQGNDLMAPKMTEVYAAADGVVRWVRDRGGSAGRYVAIEHDDGWETWYMHLNNDTPGTDDGSAPLELGVVVEAGDKVEAGDLIGWVGDSGNAEGSSAHTHFELHHNGRPIDPHTYLLDALERALEELDGSIGSSVQAI